MANCNGCIGWSECSSFGGKVYTIVKRRMVKQRVSSGSLVFILDIYPVGVYNVLETVRKNNDYVMERIKGIKMADTKNERDTCCCNRKTERTEKEYKDLIHRLNRIEGQIRGIRGMVEKDCYCADILTQVAAVNAALNSFNKVLLANHIKGCVTRDIKAGKEQTVDELVTLLQKLMK